VQIWLRTQDTVPSKKPQPGMCQSIFALGLSSLWVDGSRLSTSRSVPALLFSYRCQTERNTSLGCRSPTSPSYFCLDMRSCGSSPTSCWKACSPHKLQGVYSSCCELLSAHMALAQEATAALILMNAAVPSTERMLQGKVQLACCAACKQRSQ